MRLRLIIAFSMVIAITLTSVSLSVRQNTAQEIRLFFRGGGFLDEEELINTLKDHYKTHGSWANVEEILASSSAHGKGYGSGQGQGQGGNRTQIRLVDISSNVVFDPLRTDTPYPISSNKIQDGITLTLDDKEIIGYLLPVEGTSFPGQNFDEHLIEAVNDALLKTALISGLISLVFALALATLLLKPITQLTKASSKLASGDYSQRVSVKGHDEIALLGNTFNQMAEAIEMNQTNRRTLTADISHELRTPLAIQRANLEALIDGVYPLTIDNLEPIHAQNFMLTRLVEDLRTLALADANELSLTKHPYDLSNLVEKITSQFQAQAAQKKISVEYHNQIKNGIVNIDTGRIEQIINNLLQNSLRHTPEAGSIFINLTKQNQFAILTIRDTGPGIPTDAIPHVFERFYRAEKSRSRSEGGTGLGLAIAQKLTEIHSGNLTAANHPEKGAVFTLKIPLFNENDL